MATAREILEKVCQYYESGKLSGYSYSQKRCVYYDDYPAVYKDAIGCLLPDKLAEKLTNNERCGNLPIDELLLAPWVFSTEEWETLAQCLMPSDLSLMEGIRFLGTLQRTHNCYATFAGKELAKNIRRSMKQVYPAILD